MEDFLKATISAITAAGAPLLLSLALATAAPAEADTITPLEAYVGQLRTVQVEIGGRPARFLFDTGAGITSMTPALASEIGCAPSGRIVGFRMNGEQVEFRRCPPVELKIGGATRIREMAVFDINALLPEGLPQLDGILGLDAFRGERVTLLARQQGIRIQSTSGRAPRGAREGTMRIANESGGAGLSVFVAAFTEGPSPWLLLDSANLAGVRLHPSVWQTMAREARSQETGVTLVVAGAEPTFVSPTVSNELIYDGTLDAAFLAPYDITIDLGKQRIWWRRALH